MSIIIGEPRLVYPPETESKVVQFANTKTAIDGLLLVKISNKQFSRGGKGT